MANAYNYSNTAVPTTLAGNISAGATTVSVVSTVGFPTVPYVIAIDYGASTEELMKITSVAGLALTGTRGFGGTSAQSHSLGAVVRPVYNAQDATDFRTHEDASTGVHGVTGSVVGTGGTQTLTNKTLTSPTINGATVSGTFTGSPTISGNLTVTGDLGIDDLTADEITCSNLTSTNIGTFNTLNVTTLNTSTVTVNSASLLAASTGWTISALSVGILKPGLMTANMNFTRSGANITVDAAGALSTGVIQMGTINGVYLPLSALGTFYIHAGNSIATGTARVASGTGTVELVRWQASQTISTGNIVSCTVSWPV